MGVQTIYTIQIKSVKSCIYILGGGWVPASTSKFYNIDNTPIGKFLFF